MVYLNNYKLITFICECPTIRGRFSVLDIIYSKIHNNSLIKYCEIEVYQRIKLNYMLAQNIYI